MANAAERDAFISQWGEIAHDVGYALGIAPEVVLGQAALESGWGQSVAGNNMFGIKGAGQMVTTHEDYDGTGLKKTQESFRTYDTPEESFRGYGKLIDGDRYSGVRKGASVKDQIAAIGKSGYATDRNYTSKLAGVVGAIQKSGAFQTAQKNFQSGIVQQQVGIPDLPAELALGIAPAIGVVESSPLPDPALAPPDLPGDLYGFEQPATSAGFSLGEPDLPDFNAIGSDLSRSGIETAMQNMRADMFDRGLYGPGELPGVPDVMSQMDGPTYPDLSAGLYGGPPAADVSVPSPPDVGGLFGLDVQGPAVPSSGFHAGVDGFAPSPDFNAPSLNERSAFQNVSDRIVNDPFDATIGGLNGALMAELSQPSAPKATPAQNFDMQSAYQGDWADKFDVPLPGVPSVNAPAPRDSAPVARQAPSLPALPSPIDIPIDIAASYMSSSFDAAPPRSPGAFNSFNDYMGALGRGQADLPTGYNSAWGRTAFSDSPYANVARDDLQRATARDLGETPVGGPLDNPTVSRTAADAIKGGLMGGLFGGPVGALGGAVLGGVGSYVSENYGKGAFMNAMSAPEYAATYSPAPWSGFGLNDVRRDVKDKLGGLVGKRDYGGWNVDDGLGGYRAPDALDAMLNPDIADMMGFGGGWSLGDRLGAGLRDSFGSIGSGFGGGGPSFGGYSLGSVTLGGDPFGGGFDFGGGGTFGGDPSQDGGSRYN